MGLVNKEDFYTIIDLISLDELTDNDDDLLNNAIDNAISFVGNFIRGNYKMPDENLHQILKSIVIDIVLYNLHAKIAGKDIPEIRHKRYDNSIKLLEKISKGEIKIGLSKSEQTENVFRPEWISNKRIFPEDRSEGVGDV